VGQFEIKLHQVGMCIFSRWIKRLENKDLLNHYN
jgi:hypothetical protein